MNVGLAPNSVDMRRYKVRILCVEKKDIGRHVPEPGQMSHSSRRYYKHKDIQGSFEETWIYLRGKALVYLLLTLFILPN